ncbi:MAG: pyridoxal phosphate-dependent aminotransferase [Myxococcales bacterium]|nr:MAG: pyridoxal phosphate-dependent aminotransferase [Myxococcales bacterium]
MSHVLSKRLEAVAPSATLAMNTRALKLREQGHKVFAFAVGEPDFPTPRHITEAAYQAALGGATRYTPVSGSPGLRKAICEATEQHRGWRPEPAMVTVAAGAKAALFHLGMALYEPGDEVIVPAPYWVSYPEQVRMMGATAVIAPTHETDGWQLRPETLQASLTPRTKAIILCTPSNPTGGAYTAERLGELATVLRGHDCWIIVDEIYGDLTYDGFAHASFATVAPDLRDRTIIVDGVSKTFAMTGWRIGWTIAPLALARALDTIQGQSTSNAAAVSQAAAEAALRGPRQDLDAMRTAFDRRRHRMVDGLNAIPGVKCRLPEGAFYAFADFRAFLGKRAGDRVIEHDDDLALYLLDDAHVVTVGGGAFGAPGYLRLSYAVSDEDIDGGLAAMRASLARLA